MDRAGHCRECLVGGDQWVGGGMPRGEEVCLGPRRQHRLGHKAIVSVNLTLCSTNQPDMFCCTGATWHPGGMQTWMMTYLSQRGRTRSLGYQHGVAVGMPFFWLSVRKKGSSFDYLVRLGSPETGGHIMQRFIRFLFSGALRL